MTGTAMMVTIEQSGDPELDAMQLIVKAMEIVETPEARYRIVEWAFARYAPGHLPPLRAVTK